MVRLNGIRSIMGGESSKRQGVLFLWWLFNSLRSDEL